MNKIPNDIYSIIFLDAYLLYTQQIDFSYSWNNRIEEQKVNLFFSYTVHPFLIE